MSDDVDPCSLAAESVAFVAVERFDGRIGGIAVMRPDGPAAHWIAKRPDEGPSDDHLASLAAVTDGATAVIVHDAEVSVIVKPPVGAPDADAAPEVTESEPASDEAPDGEAAAEAASDPGTPLSDLWSTDLPTHDITTLRGWKRRADLDEWERSIDRTRAVEAHRAVDSTAPGRTDQVPVGALITITAGGQLEGHAGLRPFEATKRRTATLKADLSAMVAVHAELRRRAGCDGARAGDGNPGAIAPQRGQRRAFQASRGGRR